MPTYEFRCLICRSRSSVFLLSFKEQYAHACPHCGSTELTRIMSRFATVRSDEARADALADPASLEDVDEHDPASVRRWMKKMGKEFGDELGEDVDGAIDQTLDASPDGGGGESADTPDDL